jgi:hypothetical protein
VSHPELLKSSSNSFPSHPKGIATRFFAIEERKISIFSLFNCKNLVKKDGPVHEKFGMTRIHHGEKFELLLVF